MTAKIKSQTHSHRSGHKHKPRGLSDKKFASVYWPYIPMVLLAGLLLIFTSYNGVLASVIRHPTSMAARDYWSHQTPQGNPPWVFAQAQGYTYQKLGENLATGFSGPQATIDGWMASTEHRNNMLDNAYSQVGFGYANNPNYTAAGGGPMTIIVAFYGQPVGISDAANNQLVGSLANSGGTPTSYLPTKVATTTRAQLAFAHTPLSPYATLISLCALMLIAGIWIGRHVWKLRRVLVQGESYIIHHPMMDVGLLMIGFAFFALSKTAGLIQ
jgi:hypothetical protein